ncbi:MAG: Fic family protein, partial [Bacteroidota bacterium]
RQRYDSTRYLDFRSMRQFFQLSSLFPLRRIEAVTKQFQKRFKRYGAKTLERELQRLTIEFTWKSSQIEGNTYTLLDTERLLVQKKIASGKTHDEALMILNHKLAIDYIFKNPKLFKKITPHLIKSIHQLAVSELRVKTGFRKHGVGITGTNYKPFDNEFQIADAIEGLCHILNKVSHPFIKALIAVTGISYIQPFEDGNKRTARLAGNALLYAYDYCPISYRSVSEIEYKKAIILFYEQHSLEYFARLFTEQYVEGAKIYFP